jgi:hypothetical protein
MKSEEKKRVIIDVEGRNEFDEKFIGIQVSNQEGTTLFFQVCLYLFLQLNNCHR